MKAWQLLRKKIHFLPLMVVDLIKQVNLWWGLAYKDRKFLDSQYSTHWGESIISIK